MLLRMSLVNWPCLVLSEAISDERRLYEFRRSLAFELALPLAATSSDRAAFACFRAVLRCCSLTTV